MLLAPHIFRAYDIRGIAGKDFDEEGARVIGRGYATYLIRKDGLAQPHIVVGRDGRLTGEAMLNAFVMGLLESGCDVTDIDLSTSPLLFYATCVGEFDGGVNITASHNPKEYNGFKLQRAHAHAICGDEIQEILQICQSGDFEHGMGQLHSGDFTQQYFAKIKDLVTIPQVDGRPVKVVIDCGNGITGQFAEELFTQLGCETVMLYDKVDGRFPNHEADPEVAENLVDLKAKVLETKADLGLAFDGDGDRVGLVDHAGEHYSADLLLLLLARDILSRNAGAKIVIDLKATQVLFDEIAQLGGEGIMVQTGHSFVEEKMQEVGALLGGEVSGHIFWAENYYGFDDAFVAAAKLIEIITTSGKPVTEHFANLPTVYNTPEIKLPCSEKNKFAVVEQLVEHFVGKYGEEKCLTIDGVRIDFGDGAWGIVRASNTSPKLTLRFEARTPGGLEEIKAEVMGETEKRIRIKNG